MKKCKAIFFFFLPFVPFHVILHTLVPETVAGFIDRHLFPPAESETSHWKQATPGKNKWPAHRKWGTETKTWIGHSWLKREGKKRMESWEGKWCGLDCRDWKIVLILFKSFFPSKVQVMLSTGNDADLGIGSSESAALRLCVPPQQVQAQQSLNLKTSQWIQIVLTLQTMRWVPAKVWVLRFPPKLHNNSERILIPPFFLSLVWFAAGHSGHPWPRVISQVLWTRLPGAAGPVARRGWASTYHPISNYGAHIS